MLELTRRVGEQVRIARGAAVITVQSLNTGLAVLSIVQGPEFTIHRGEVYELGVAGVIVHIHLLAVKRGECRLGFQAPRWIAIERPERTGEQHAEE